MSKLIQATRSETGRARGPKRAALGMCRPMARTLRERLVRRSHLGGRWGGRNRIARMRISIKDMGVQRVRLVRGGEGAIGIVGGESMAGRGRWVSRVPARSVRLEQELPLRMRALDMGRCCARLFFIPFTLIFFLLFSGPQPPTLFLALHRRIMSCPPSAGVGGPEEGRDRHHCGLLVYGKQGQMIWIVCGRFQFLYSHVPIEKIEFSHRTCVRACSRGAFFAGFSTYEADLHFTLLPSAEQKRR